MMMKVQQIKETLGIEASNMPQAVQAANQMMGLPSEGPLPQQIAALLAQLGISDDSAPAASAATAAPATTTAPAAAAMSFTLRCSSGQNVSAEAPPTESVGFLMLAVQRATGIHASTQRLVFAGTALPATELIASTPLVDGSTIFVLVQRDAGFPAKLGPFQTVSVPFNGATDINFFVGDDLADAGAMWTMEPPAVSRHKLRCANVEFPLVGQFSPPHPVTLTAEEKAAIHIPSAASQFVFSYPVVSGTKLTVQPGGSDTAASFLSVGGFAYLDRSARLLHATTLVPSDKAEGGLQFGPPKRWRAEWTTALMRQGRFQRITIKPLNDVGAMHFCWVRPGERIAGCAEQPDVPHGGFAYLFHDSPLGGSADELVLDRYFAVVSGDEYVADTDGAGAQQGAAATFAVVSDLNQLNELRDRVAAAGTSAVEQTQLNERIGRLETQLAQATRCVVCLDEAKDTILDPCRHLCMCEGCAARVRQCPVCRAPIRGRRKAFTS